MKLAALYDIHGNLPALEAVLDEMRGAGVSHVVVGGDVLPGPLPRQTLSRLMNLDMPVRWIRGNGDRVVLEELSGKEPAEVPEQFRDVIRWNAQQLDPAQVPFVASWPATCVVPVEGLGDVLFCHATPRNDSEIFTGVTSADKVLRAFAGVDAALVICGHTHMPFDRTVDGIRIVNAGSVGMPFGEPGADWLLLGPGVELRHTPYDLTTAAQQIRATGCPQADDFAANYVLRPPSAAKMLEAFGQAELT
jgi:putative phosphoesterase